ncbi:dihydroorotate dehydrogenase electron transfer subunit [Rossellomorea sp. BNER]|jgi:dihydroorotate dehydrogenase electron transfer subunit|uniref:dihydroorotate dehydrogenase electron transfer subunit n=1 Tax=Rossellomorea sp. BNER TaxID=2962031 RepID=UPI003AF2F54E|nr:dihydroorotate dehydrogenase electron transfer subunit [Rossellomorea sp. BNER]
MIKNERMEVLSHQHIAKNIYELTVKGQIVDEIQMPGQFVHIKVGKGFDPLLRRPISISSYSKEDQTMTLIYRAEGKGTRILSEVLIGQDIDVLGPLGNGFPIHEQDTKTALLVGGGIGVPPLYELSKQLTGRGWKVLHVLGFQSKDVVFYEEEFAELGETFIATVDGSHGSKGFVTDIISNLDNDFDLYYTCGPTPMLKALENTLTHKQGYISLEQRMGCGIGACFACVCHKSEDPTGNSYVKVCSDGPVFPAGEVAL